MDIKGVKGRMVNVVPNLANLLNFLILISYSMAFYNREYKKHKVKVQPLNFSQVNIQKSSLQNTNVGYFVLFFYWSFNNYLTL